MQFEKKSDIFSKDEIVNINFNFSTEQNVSLDLIEQKVRFYLNSRKKYQNYINEKFETDSSRLLSLFDTEASIRNNELLFFKII